MRVVLWIAAMAIIFVLGVSLGQRVIRSYDLDPYAAAVDRTLFGADEFNSPCTSPCDCSMVAKSTLMPKTPSQLERELRCADVKTDTPPGNPDSFTPVTPEAQPATPAPAQ